MGPIWGPICASKCTKGLGSLESNSKNSEIPCQSREIEQLCKTANRYANGPYYTVMVNGDISYDKGSFQGVQTMTITMTDVECFRLMQIYRRLNCGLVFSLAESRLKI